MESKLWRRMTTAAAVAALALTGGILFASGEPAKSPAPKASAHDREFASERAIVGTWRVQVQQYNCQTEAPVGPAFPSFLTFGDGGTLVEGTTNPAFAPGQRGAGYGVWSVEERRAYSAKSTAFIQFTTPAAPPANPGFTAGTQTISQKIAFDHDLNSFSSDATVEFADSHGTVYRQGCAHAAATRYE